MIIICHNCESHYKVRDDIVAGGPKKARCKNCGADMLIYPPEAGESAETGVRTRPAVQTAATSPPPKPAQPSPPEAAAPPAAKPSPPAPPKADAADGAGPAASPESAGATGEATGAGPGGDSAPEASADNAMAKLEKRRREMEDEIAGRLHKAALETLDFQDLERLGSKLKEIESNPEIKLEDDVQLFACIKCKSIFGLYPADTRQCPNCVGEIPLIRGQDILRQFGMFNR